MKVSAQTRIQVTDLIDQFADYYSRKDLEGVSSLVSPSCTLIFPGTGLVIRDREEFRDLLTLHFARVPALTMRFSDPEICAEGTIAWVIGSATISPDVENTPFNRSHLRFTAVLRGTGHAWEISHLHISPQPGNPENGLGIL